MKHSAFTVTLLLLWLSPVDMPAAVCYVDINSPSPTPPYVSWSTAATNIQDAVDVAVSGDQILVTNGVYQTGGKALAGTTNRVTVDRPVVLQSVNGPGVTLIDGGAAIRCVFLTNGSALNGFTLTNGMAPSGAGVLSSSTSALITNCVLVANRASSGKGGGALGGTLDHCTLISNSVPIYYSGGGASGCLLNYCTLTGNSAAWGGGASECTLVHCVLTGNRGSDSTFFPITFAGFGGGADHSTLDQCILSGNSAAAGGGAAYCQLRNCTLRGNSATGAFTYNGLGGGGGAIVSALTNCTVCSNSVVHANVGGGGGVNGCTLINSIVYFNDAPDSPNYASAFGHNYLLEFCCTMPMPTNGIGNITNAPLFVDLTLGDFHLQANSPCIDAGTNLSIEITNDLNGRPRPLDGNADGVVAFDMGAYEHAVLFVRQDNPNPVWPYNSWLSAATNIQDAVDAGVTGDDILVTNGVYATGGPTGVRVWVNRRLSLRSVNGPQFTFIRGAHLISCVSLSPRASLSGFTLTNGSATYNGSPGAPTLRGGGVICYQPYQYNVISNCVLIGNSADEGGGAFGGTLINCTLMNNSARYGGGGASGGGSASGGPRVGCMLINCTLIGNQSGDLDGGGGVHNGILTNCTLANNSATFGAGAMGSTLDRCTLVGNDASHCSLYNSTLTGSGGYGATACYLQNCTLTYNGAGAYNSSLRNCIIFDNFVNDYEGDSDLNFCCTRVMPTNGIGNITNAPIFVDQFGGNLRLASNSPCINAGQNAYAPGFTDLDGSPRIAGGTVDIGAYEFQTPASVLSYAWAQQYGLPTDGSADYLDPDGDRMNNWQEWIAGTDPTNALSALRLLTPTADLSGFLLTWQSVSNRTYFVERVSTLAGPTPFSTIASNIPGQPGTTSYTDTNAPGPFFYRVGVQP